MFDKKFSKRVRHVAVKAQEEARALGSPTVEAEHLLRALAHATGEPAAATLAGAGLDHAAVREALETERAETLAAVGVSVSAFDLPPVAPGESRPGWGTSAKLSLQRAVNVAGARGDKGIEPAHVLLGILLAEAGTVPRALTRAGVAPSELERQTRLALDAAAQV